MSEFNAENMEENIVSPDTTEAISASNEPSETTEEAATEEPVTEEEPTEEASSPEEPVSEPDAMPAPEEEPKKTEEEEPTPVPKKKGRFLGVIKFVITVISILSVFSLVAWLLVFIYAQNDSDGKIGVSNDVIADETPLPTKDSSPVILLPPDKTNFLILGVDESGVSANIGIAVTYDYLNQEVSLVSIPCDTKITISQTDVTALKDKGRAVPSDGVMKIKELHSYAGKVEGHIYYKKYIEALLGMKVDYYLKIDAAALEKIIDGVGGVQMEVRSEGYYYNGVEVEGGFQLLNGKKAAGVLGFHDYSENGDLEAIAVCQKFMKEFFNQTLGNKYITDNMSEHLNSLIGFVQTDFSSDKVLLYTDAVKKIKPVNIKFYTLPGDILHDYGRDDRNWFYIYNPAETLKLMTEILGLTPPSPEPTTSATRRPSATAKPATTDIRQIKIQILNGGYTTGKAAEVRDTLRAAGFTVTSVGDEKGEKKNETRILTRYKMDTDELEDFFKNAVVEVNADLRDYDIIIIIGTGE